MAEPRNDESPGGTCDLVITGAPADLGDRLARAAESGGLDSASELAVAVLGIRPVRSGSGTVNRTLFDKQLGGGHRRMTGDRKKRFAVSGACRIR